MVAKAEDCIVDSFGGRGHTYNECIKSPDKVIEKCKNDSMGYDCISKNMGGLLKYAQGMILDPKDVISNSKCGRKLGNKYVMKTGSKCKDINNNNTLVEKYTYINNMDTISLVTGRPSNSIFESAISKISKINPTGIFGAIVDNSQPECKEVRVQCHVRNEEGELYDQISNPVHISLDEINNIGSNNLIEIESFNNYNKKINYSKIENNNKINKQINDAYYLLLSLLMLYLVFKLIHKK